MTSERLQQPDATHIDFKAFPVGKAGKLESLA